MAVFGFTFIVACLLVARSAVASDLPNVTVRLLFQIPKDKSTCHTMRTCE